MPLLKRLLRAVFFVPITLILLFEEWGWEPLSRLFAHIARLPVWAWAEKKISTLPPWAALLQLRLYRWLQMPENPAL